MTQRLPRTDGSGPLRILLLVTGLRLGGAEQQVAALSRAFSAMGHAVAVVSLTTGREVTLAPAAEYRAVDMRKTPWSMLRSLLEVRTFVKAWRPDVIHSHMVHANLFARMLTRIVAAPPLVCTAHSMREGGRLRMALYRITDSWCALTTHVSAAGRQQMIDVGAARPSRLAVVANGIDTAAFHPDAARRHATRAALPLSPDARLLLNVGRLVEEKDQATLIEAFARVRQQGFDVRLAIAGDGPRRQSLEQKIHSLGLDDAAWLLGRRADVAELMTAADVFVLSSRIEGMPLVVGEAMACGTSVVSTDAPGVKELCGSLARIVPTGDAQALAEAICAALREDPHEAGQAAARRERVVSQFGLQATAARWIDIYHQLIQAPRLMHRGST
ncbi:glycosyltransferase [Cupriavidus agavae]|uniref:Glycosyltransferase involved in cell wall biosynthesis n=1 Tax=Cupriavidus agavae TaxID=1001822 RepID=A0A4Q7S4I0_9BURK|nr:glycosyltransferase [Cupriavidus agavae]RZT41356.1 glycosyltransferase involved in cell wall biosynthesis [Cupriavidus agavae]